MISMYKTGHSGNRTTDSCDNCGTCDGGRCHRCQDIWVEDGVTYRTYEEAKAASHSLVELCGDDDPSGFTIQNGILMAQVYVYSSEEEGYRGYLMVECNKESKLYQQKMEETKEGMKKFEECKCTDKHCSAYANSCDVFNCCTDSSCYMKMKNGKRTTRMWYM